MTRRNLHSRPISEWTNSHCSSPWFVLTPILYSFYIFSNWECEIWSQSVGFDSIESFRREWGFNRRRRRRIVWSLLTTSPAMVSATPLALSRSDPPLQNVDWRYSFFSCWLYTMEFGFLSGLNSSVLGFVV